MNDFWEIIKTWEWGNNFILPLLVIILTAIGWKLLIKKAYLELVQKFKYLRRETSYAIFEECIKSSDFNSPCALDKIKILKRLRKKRIKQFAMIGQGIIKVILIN